jgi:hypothetical protein
MPLTASSLQRWRDDADLIRINPIPPHEFEIACRIYSDMWGKLDHGRVYGGINPVVLAASLLERAGVGRVYNVPRYTGVKSEHYNDLVCIMWMTAFGYAPVMNLAAPHGTPGPCPVPVPPHGTPGPCPALSLAGLLDHARSLSLLMGLLSLAGLLDHALGLPSISLILPCMADGLADRRSI